MKYRSTTDDQRDIGLQFVYRPGASSTSPLVIFVHGRAGNRDVMWTFERCVPSSHHIVSFEAFLADPIGGWSWWMMTAEGSRREAIEVATQRLAAAVQAFIQRYTLQPACTIAVGFSQGAVLVSHAALAGAVPCDGIGLLAGYALMPKPYNGESQITSAFIAHGTLDETVPISRAQAGAESLKQIGIAVEYVEEPVGHKLGIEGTRALKGWMDRLSA